MLFRYPSAASKHPPANLHLVISTEGGALAAALEKSSFSTIAGPHHKGLVLVRS